MRRWLRKIYRWAVPVPIPPCDEATLIVLQTVLRTDSNCVDIGCNRGSILREIIRVAPQGRHFAFEPIPSLFQKLRRRFPSVACHHLALSDSAGSVRFHHYVDMDGFSGMVKRDLGIDPGHVKEIEVQTACLDDILQAEVPIHLIKIDVEGAELNVLRGAIRSLRKWRPVVIFECGKGGLDKYGHKPEEIFELLTDCGLGLRLLNGWSQNRPAFSSQQFVDEFWANREYMFVASPL